MRKIKCGVDIMPILKPKDMAEKLGVMVKTLQKWDNQGILKAYRTPTKERKNYISFSQHKSS